MKLGVVHNYQYLWKRTEYARGEGVWDHRTLSPQNQPLFLITDNVL